MIDQPELALIGVRFGFTLLPAILMVVSLLILRKYHLDEETKAMLGIEEQ